MIELKGFLLSFLAAIAAGGAFTQAMPATMDDWWKFGMGLIVATATQYLAYRRQDQNRKDVWTDEQRKEQA